jgi:hypothetical protein
VEWSGVVWSGVEWREHGAAREKREGKEEWEWDGTRGCYYEVQG